jgi:hypothetical protein
MRGLATIPIVHLIDVLIAKMIIEIAHFLPSNSMAEILISTFRIHSN